jgi:hypothetical protein
MRMGQAAREANLSCRVKSGSSSERVTSLGIAPTGPCAPCGAGGCICAKGMHQGSIVGGQSPAGSRWGAVYSSLSRPAPLAERSLWCGAAHDSWAARLMPQLRPAAPCCALLRPVSQRQRPAAPCVTAAAPCCALCHSGSVYTLGSWPLRCDASTVVSCAESSCTYCASEDGCERQARERRAGRQHGPSHGCGWCCGWCCGAGGRGRHGGRLCREAGAAGGAGAAASSSGCPVPCRSRSSRPSRRSSSQAAGRGGAPAPGRGCSSAGWCRRRC